MGISILEGDDYGGRGVTRAVMVCNTTNIAFGPLFDDHDEAQGFLDWHEAQGYPDPRTVTGKELDGRYIEYRKLMGKGEDDG